eukprot:3362637-Amphidinium_carterae.1
MLHILFAVLRLSSTTCRVADAFHDKKADPLPTQLPGGHCNFRAGAQKEMHVHKQPGILGLCFQHPLCGMPVD